MPADEPPYLVRVTDLAAALRRGHGAAALDEACRRLGDAQINGDEVMVGLMIDVANLLLEAGPTGTARTGG